MSIDRKRHRLRAPGLAGFRVVTHVTRGVARSIDIETPFSRWRDHSAILLEQRLAYDLRLARQRAALPQWVLAERLGRAQSFVAKLEASTPTRHLLVCELVQLCTLMRRHPSELLTHVVEQPSVRDVLAAAPPYPKARR